MYFPGLNVAMDRDLLSPSKARQRVPWPRKTRLCFVALVAQRWKQTTVVRTTD